MRTQGETASGSASRSAASRTRSSCAGAAATSPTSSRPACCTPPCCAARTRTRAIVSIDTSAAAALDGVHAVITGAQAAELTDPLPDFGPDPAKHAWRCLAVDKVRYVGEGVAVAVADSRYLAEDALALIDVEYEPLPAVVDPEAALLDGAPLVHEALGTNCAYERTFDFGDVERDFAEADVIVSDRLRWHRSGGQPLETVGRDRRLRPRHRRAHRAHQLAELHQLPVHGGGHAEDPGEQARRPARCPRAAASARSCSSPSRWSSRGCARARSGGPWSTSRTASTTSPTATTTAPTASTTSSSR